MNYHLYYGILNAAILLPWLMLMALPNWNMTKWTASSHIFPISIGLVYGLLLLLTLGKAEGDFSTLEGIQKLFSHDGIMLAGWTHYLCLDLLAGNFIFSDAQQRGIKHIWLVPILMTTLMFAPIGVVLYFGLRRLA